MLKQTANISIIVSIFTFFASPVLAAPTIDSISGEFIHGQNITIEGTGFGTKTQASPAFWDDMAYVGLTDGDEIPIGGSNPWPAFCSNVPVYYKTSNSRGKWAAHYTNQWSTNIYKKGAMDGAIINGVTDKAYATWWLYSSSHANPKYCHGGSNANNICTVHEDCPDVIEQCYASASNKWARFLSGGWGAAGEGTIMWGTSVLNIYDFSSAGSISKYPNGPIVGQWNRVELYFDSSIGAYSPQVSVWINGNLSGTYNSSPYTFTWAIDVLGCIGFDGSNTPAAIQPTVDWGEIYADNTQARVEICSGSTWPSRGTCEIQIPHTTWNDGQLQVTVNQGSFSDNSSQYLYVVDGSGVANANGFLMTFGTGGSDMTAPSNPVGLSVM